MPRPYPYTDPYTDPDTTLVSYWELPKQLGVSGELSWREIEKKSDIFNSNKFRRVGGCGSLPLDILHLDVMMSYKTFDHPKSQTNGFTAVISTAVISKHCAFTVKWEEEISPSTRSWVAELQLSLYSRRYSGRKCLLNEAVILVMFDCLLVG